VAHAKRPHAARCTGVHVLVFMYWCSCTGVHCALYSCSFVLVFILFCLCSCLLRCTRNVQNRSRGIKKGAARREQLWLKTLALGSMPTCKPITPINSLARRVRIGLNHGSTPLCCCLAF